jgi:hypothetical protein
LDQTLQDLTEHHLTQKLKPCLTQAMQTKEEKKTKTTQQTGQGKKKQKKL